MNTEMILKLDKLQPRKDKPAVLGSITLLDSHPTFQRNRCRLRRNFSQAHRNERPAP